MVRRNKSGQVEDIFGDLFPGLILIIIAIFIIGISSSSHTENISLEADKDLKKLYDLDRITFLRSSAELGNIHMADDKSTIGDLLVTLADYSRSGSGPVWVDSTLVEPDGTCGPRINDIINSAIGDYAFEWSIVIDDGASQLFSCHRESYLDESAKIVPFFIPVPGVGVVGKVAVKYGIQVFAGSKLVDHNIENKFILPSKVQGNYNLKVKVHYFGFE